MPSNLELKGYGLPGYGEGKSHDEFDLERALLRANEHQPMAQDTMNALIEENDNKDFFELIKGMLPSAGTMENFHPGMAIPKLLQLFNQPAGTEQAFQRGLTESIFGEPDPVGPQGLPFSEFLRQKRIEGNEKSRQGFLETVGPSSDWEQFGNILQANPGQGYGYRQKQPLNPKVKSIVEEHINKNLFKK